MYMYLLLQRSLKEDMVSSLCSGVFLVSCVFGVGGVELVHYYRVFKKPGLLNLMQRP